jgi:hypothetical protein
MKWIYAIAALWALWNVSATFTCDKPSPWYWPPVTYCE